MPRALTRPLRQSLIMALCALALTAMIAGCVQRLPTYRYKLTVIVDTPEGRRIGSSVNEVQASMTTLAPFPAANGYNADTIQEAVPVALPDGKFLFAMIGSRGSDGGAAKLMMDGFEAELRQADALGSGNDQISKRARAIAKLKGARRLSTEVYPTLIRFRDLSDPSTAEEVDPGDLPASFGPGYRLVGMMVGLTDDPPTRQLEKILPWIEDGSFELLGNPASSIHSISPIDSQHNASQFDLSRGGLNGV